jgi:hypothetical protein
MVFGSVSGNAKKMKSVTAVIEVRMLDIGLLFGDRLQSVGSKHV